MDKLRNVQKCLDNGSYYIIFAIKCGVTDFKFGEFKKDHDLVMDKKVADDEIPFFAFSWDHESKRQVAYTGKIVDNKDGTIWYCQNGYVHKDDGPAFVDKDKLEWHRNGVPHRKDGPARITIDGIKQWFLNGKEYTLEQYWERQKDTEYASNILAETYCSTEDIYNRHT